MLMVDLDAEDIARGQPYEQRAQDAGRICFDHHPRTASLSSSGSMTRRMTRRTGSSMPVKVRLQLEPKAGMAIGGSSAQDCANLIVMYRSIAYTNLVGEPS
jgi:hypothetical protein